MWYTILRIIHIIADYKDFIDKIEIDNTRSVCKEFNNLKISFNPKIKLGMRRLQLSFLKEEHKYTEDEIKQIEIESNAAEKLYYAAKIIECDSWQECVNNAELCYDAFSEFIKTLKDVKIEIICSMCNIEEYEPFEKAKRQAIKKDFNTWFNLKLSNDDLYINNLEIYELVQKTKEYIVKGILHSGYEDPLHKIINDKWRGLVSRNEEALNRIYKKIDKQRESYILSKICHGELTVKEAKKYPELIKTVEILTDIKNTCKRGY